MVVIAKDKIHKDGEREGTGKEEGEIRREKKEVTWSLDILEIFHLT